MIRHCVRSNVSLAIVAALLATSCKSRSFNQNSEAKGFFTSENCNLAFEVVHRIGTIALATGGIAAGVGSAIASKNVADVPTPIVQKSETSNPTGIKSDGDKLEITICTDEKDPLNPKQKATFSFSQGAKNFLIVGERTAIGHTLKMNNDSPVQLTLTEIKQKEVGNWIGTEMPLVTFNLTRADTERPQANGVTTATIEVLNAVVENGEWVTVKENGQTDVKPEDDYAIIRYRTSASKAFVTMRVPLSVLKLWAIPGTNNKLAFRNRSEVGSKQQFSRQALITIDRTALENYEARFDASFKSDIFAGLLAANAGNALLSVVLSSMNIAASQSSKKSNDTTDEQN